MSSTLCPIYCTFTGSTEPRVYVFEGGGGEGGKDPDARYGQFEFIYHNVCVGRKYSLNI